MAELCKSWPERWDEHVSPAIWIKRTLPDLSLPSRLTLRDTVQPATSHVARLVGTTREQTRGRRRPRQLRREAQAEYARGPCSFGRATRLAGGCPRKSQPVHLETVAGNVCGAGQPRTCAGIGQFQTRGWKRGRKLHHQLYTGPWEVSEVLQKGLSVRVLMKGRRQRDRRVSLADVKLFHTRPVPFRHSLADEFAQFAWTSDFMLPRNHETTTSFD